MKTLHTFFAPLILLLCCGAFLGCNALETFDAPTENPDRVRMARYLSDNGDCAGARDILYQYRSSRDDELLHVLGFAQLCLAGATLTTLGPTIVTYTSSNGNDFTVVGKLARLILPYTTSKRNQIDDAIISFNSISDGNRRGYTTLVGHLTKLAIIVAQASPDNVNLTRDNIATAACTGTGACADDARFSDTAAADFQREVVQMSNDMGSVQLTGLRDLAVAINNIFAAAGTQAIRYYVRNNVVPNP